MNDNIENNLDFTIGKELDSSLPHSLRRSIWLIDDEEDNCCYSADEILDNVSQDRIFNMRATLAAAYKSGENKYVCKLCQQPVGIKIRTNEGDFFPFFSHYQNSGQCPLKKETQIDPLHTIRSAQYQFQTSQLYNLMIERLVEVLEKSSSFKDVEINKLISSPIIKGYRKPSVYSVYNDNKLIAFDLLISNPLLGLLVGRNAFYKMHRIFYLWLFPTFSQRYQRLCQKDILYMNRRNVFVFDSKEFSSIDKNRYIKEDPLPNDHKYAYEESIKQNRLMLNCYWQVPEITNINGENKIGIKWMGPKLVAFEDLKFDDATNEIYYHDSDIDFYESYPPDIQKQINEWLKIKQDRWRKIFDGIEKRKHQYEEMLRNREWKEKLLYYYEMVRNGEMIPEPFQDPQTNLYGFKVGDFDLIPATYYEAKPFNDEYAWVRKKEKWGLIDYRNQKICNFQFSEIKYIGNNLYIGYKNKKYSLLNHRGEILGNETFDDIKPIGEGFFRISRSIVTGYDRGWTGKWFYNKANRENIYGVIDKQGRTVLPCRMDFVGEFKDGKLEVRNNRVTSYIDNQGNEEYEIVKETEEVKIYKSGLLNKFGLMDISGNKITLPIFEEIGDFYEGVAPVKKYDYYDSKYGFINKSGEIVYDYKYERLKYLSRGKYSGRINNKVIIFYDLDKKLIDDEFDEIYKHDEEFIYIKKNDKIGLLSYEGIMIVPCEYDYISNFVDGKAQVTLNKRNSFIDKTGKETYRMIDSQLPGIFIYVSLLKAKSGLMDADNNPITGLIFDSINPFNDEVAVCKSGSKWGLIDSKGELLIPFEFDYIKDFENGEAEACKNRIKFTIDKNGNEVFKRRRINNQYQTMESKLQNKIGIFTNAGEEVTGLIFSALKFFQGDGIIAQKDGKWGLIKFDGEEIIPFENDSIDVIINHRLLVNRNGKFGVIDYSGAEILPIEYDNIIEISNDNYIFKKDKLYALSKNDGELITPYNFQELKKVNNSFIAARQDNKWGLLDHSGQVIIPIEYDAIPERFKEEFYRVKKNKKWGVINKENKLIVDYFYDGIGSLKGDKLMVLKGFRWKSIKFNVDPINNNASEKKKSTKIDLSNLEYGKVYDATILNRIPMGVLIKIEGIGEGLIPVKWIYSNGLTFKNFKGKTNLKVELYSKNEEKNRATFKVSNPNELY